MAAALEDELKATARRGPQRGLLCLRALLQSTCREEHCHEAFRSFLVRSTDLCLFYRDLFHDMMFWLL